MKKIYKLYTGIAAILSLNVFLIAPAGAHGYITSPASRTFLCNKKINTGCGAIANEPQSVEGLKGFPASGPSDGTLASGGNSRFPELNQQSLTRWNKVNLPAGNTTFNWTLTATHRTTSWRYFITKPGWNAASPLSRDAFDLTPFCEINANGAVPSTSVSHTCRLPADRTGYHVILAVWDIADTSNAFYQAIDVNITR